LSVALEMPLVPRRVDEGALRNPDVPGLCTGNARGLIGFQESCPWIGGCCPAVEQRDAFCGSRVVILSLMGL